MVRVVDADHTDAELVGAVHRFGRRGAGDDRAEARPTADSGRAAPLGDDFDSPGRVDVAVFDTADEPRQAEESVRVLATRVRADEDFGRLFGVGGGDTVRAEGVGGDRDRALAVDFQYVDGPMRWMANWLSPIVSLSVSLPLTTSISSSHSSSVAHSTDSSPTRASLTSTSVCSGTRSALCGLPVILMVGITAFERVWPCPVEMTMKCAPPAPMPVTDSAPWPGVSMMYIPASSGIFEP